MNNTISNPIPLKYFTKYPNWGDALNPILIKYMTGREIIPLPPDRTDKTNYLCIGSILAWADEFSIVYGTGLIAPTHLPYAKPKEICAVRGPLTAYYLRKNGIKCPDVFGDPALLLPRYYNPKVSKSYKLGIIPHYVDKDSPYLHNLISDEVLIIDVLSDVMQFVDQLLSCQYIASSSLHGLIAADAYGLPSVWLKFSDKIIGQDFKFRDYLASCHRPLSSPLVVTSQIDIRNILSSITNYEINVDLDRLFRAHPF